MRRWTTEEDRIAVEMLKNGAKDADVAERFGRSLPSVRCRNCSDWKIHLRLWTEEEDRRGAEMVRERVPFNAVAEQLGRTLISIQSRNSEVWKAHPIWWTEKEETILKEMWGEGAKAEEIAVRLGREIQAVEARKKRFKFDRRGRKHPPANVGFFKEWTEKSAYVYGLLVTDGCVHERPWTKPPTRKVEIAQSGDPTILYQIQAVTGGAIYGPYKKKGRKDSYKLTLVGKAIVEAVKAFGVFPRKTFTVQIPPVPERYWPHFFRGVVDGDGSLALGGATKERRLAGKVGLELRVGSACEKFRDGLAEAVAYFTGIKGSLGVSTKKRKHPEYRVTWSWGTAEDVAAWMYAGKELSFWFPRKFQVYEQTRKRLGSI